MPDTMMIYWDCFCFAIFDAKLLPFLQIFDIGTIKLSQILLEHQKIYSNFSFVVNLLMWSMWVSIEIILCLSISNETLQPIYSHTTVQSFQNKFKKSWWRLWLFSCIASCVFNCCEYQENSWKYTTVVFKPTWCKKSKNMSEIENQ